MNYLGALKPPSPTIPLIPAKLVEEEEIVSLEAAGGTFKTGEVKELVVIERKGRRRAPNVDESLIDETALACFEQELNCAERPNPSTFYKHYHGEINLVYRKPQYVLVRDVGQKILFSQRSVSNFTQGARFNYPLSDLAGKMFRKFSRSNERPNDGVLDIIHIGEGVFTSIDNRRLLIAKKIAKQDRRYGIWVRTHEFTDELFPVQLKKRFNAETWGEALQVRMCDMRKLGFKQYPTIVSFSIRGDIIKMPQEILINLDGCNLSNLEKEDAKAIQSKVIRGELLI